MKKSKNVIIKLSLIVIFFLGGIGNYLYGQQGTVEKRKTMSIKNLVSDDGDIRTVTEAMEHYNLKGLSVAVFEDYKISWTETWGVKDEIENEEIDKFTSFSTASIAKPFTATLFAILEEKGLIDLKVPVSTYLKRWKLPESEFTKDIDVTIEHLLSHTAGTTQHGFADFYQGDKIPTLVESLQGKLPRYDNTEIAFTFKPGTDFKYSGGGYVIAQLAVEDHLGKTLSELAYEHILEPLGMVNSTMIQPHENNFSLTNMAKAHDNDGNLIRTGIPITPQVAPSGLWSTPTDMAIFAIEIQNALRGAKTKVISPQVAKRVTQIATLKGIGGYSLGWQRGDGFGNYDWFTHGGSNTGTGGHVYASMSDGNGIVFFGNSGNGCRIPVLNQLRNSILKAHEWRIPVNKKTIAITAEIVAPLTGSYEMIAYPEEKFQLKFEDGKLFFSSWFQGEGRADLNYIGDNSFIIDEYPNTLKFELNPTDGKYYVAFIREDFKGKKAYIFKTADLRGQLFKEILEAKAYENTVKTYQDFTKDEKDFKIKEDVLNNWGYGLLGQNKKAEAVEIFKLAVYLFPKSANTYDSLGEAFSLLGNTKKAILNYELSFKLNPHNTNATKQIEILKKKSK